jgi:TonB-dependent SusC/RagA subfamily outer membrane receptor
MQILRKSFRNVSIFAVSLAAGACVSAGGGSLPGPAGEGGTRATASGTCVTRNSLSQADYDAESSLFVEDLLSRIPGVDVYRSPTGYSVQIRGVNPLTAGAEPLYVIDGMPYQGTRNGSIPVNVSDIECVEVLKDVGQTSIFGSRGANGVVLITTRRR